VTRTQLRSGASLFVRGAPDGVGDTAKGPRISAARIL